MELKNIAILGPRGNVGKAVISQLAKYSTRFNVYAITRPDSTYAPPSNYPGTLIVNSADYGSLDALITALKGMDAVVNCVSGGATQYDPSKLIIDAAVAADVKLYFANEFVGHVTSEQFGRMPEAAVGAKVRIRKYLEELGSTGKLTWTSLNGGPFFDMWLMKGPAGFDIPNKRARIYGTGNNPLLWTPLPTIALAVVNILLDPKPVLNRPIYICPIPNLTQNAILSAVETVLATELSVENIDVAKINKNAKIALERGEIGKAMKGLTVSNQFYEGDSGNDFRHLVTNEIVGVEMMSVEDAVRGALQDWGTDTPIVEGMFNVEPCEI